MVTIKLRRGPSAEWLAANPVLADGEVGIESSPGLIPDKGKIGDGVTPWSGLAYSVSSDWIPLAEKGVAGGVASLDGLGLVPVAQLPGAAALDAEVTAAVTAHAASGSAHIGTYVARSGGTTPAVAPLGYLNVKDFGALGDGRYVENCQITNGSPNIAMPGAALTNATVPNLYGQVMSTPLAISEPWLGASVGGQTDLPASVAAFGTTASGQIQYTEMLP